MRKREKEHKSARQFLIELYVAKIVHLQIDSLISNPVYIKLVFEKIQSRWLFFELHPQPRAYEFSKDFLKCIFAVL